MARIQRVTTEQVYPNKTGQSDQYSSKFQVNAANFITHLQNCMATYSAEKQKTMVITGHGMLRIHLDIAKSDAEMETLRLAALRDWMKAAPPEGYTQEQVKQMLQELG